MNRIIRRAGTLLATFAIVTAGTMVVAPGAHATHPFTFCNNTPTAPADIRHEVITLPGGLGTVTIHLATSQDSYVSYDGPGDPLDTVVGVDLGTISLTEDIQVCFLLPIVGNQSVLINIAELSVELCSWSGPAGHGGTFSCVPIV